MEASVNWARALDQVRALVPADRFARSILGRDAFSPRGERISIDQKLAREFHEAVVTASAAACYQRPADAVRAMSSADTAFDLVHESTHYRERVARTDMLLALLPSLVDRVAGNRIEYRALIRDSGGIGLATTLDRSSGGEILRIHLHLSCGPRLFEFVVDETMVPAAIWREYWTVLDAQDRVARTTSGR